MTGMWLNNRAFCRTISLSFTFWAHLFVTWRRLWSAADLRLLHAGWGLVNGRLRSPPRDITPPSRGKGSVWGAQRVLVCAVGVCESVRKTRSL